MINKPDDAVKILLNAWELDKSYKEVSANLWALAAQTKKQVIVDRLKKEIDVKTYEADQIRRIAGGYQRIGDYASAIPFYQILVVKIPNEAKYHAVLAALLVEVGRTGEARVHVEEAMRLDPDFIPEGQQFLDSLKKK